MLPKLKSANAIQIAASNRRASFGGNLSAKTDLKMTL